MGVYSSNNLTRDINFHNDRNAKYPFPIFTADRNNIAGTNWWSFFRYSSKKKLFLFDSLGFTAFKEFIIDNDLNKFNKYDEKINLINFKF